MGNKGIFSYKGNYKNLKVYKYLVIIYDITFKFKDRFLSIGDRTQDQMEQSARSGKQNLAEGSIAGQFSSHSELLLTNVSRASLQELLEDYEDYLRARNLNQWKVDDSRTSQTRKIVQDKINNFNEEETPKYFLEIAKTRTDETLANIALTMIHMADKMLVGLLKKQENDFLSEGGTKERMYKARLQSRNNPNVQKPNLNPINKSNTQNPQNNSNTQNKQNTSNTLNNTNSPTTQNTSQNLNRPNTPNPPTTPNTSNNQNSQNSQNTRNTPNTTDSNNTQNPPSSS